MSLYTAHSPDTGFKPDATLIARKEKTKPKSSPAGQPLPEKKKEPRPDEPLAPGQWHHMLVRQKPQEFSAKDDSGDRRRDTRTELDETVAIEWKIESNVETTQFLVLTRNISSGGIALTHDQKLEPGTQCDLTMFMPDGTTQVWPGRVAHCTTLTRGMYEIGIQFDQAIDMGCLGLTSPGE